MSVTIKDLAQRTGFSTATISMVLNHKEHRIPKATCDIIFLAAQEMGYRPNRIASSLVTKRTKTIGLIIPDITNMFFAETASVVERECQKLGYSLFLCNTNDKANQDLAYINVLLEHNVDGLLYVMSLNSDYQYLEGCLEVMRNSGTPVLLIDRTWENGALPQVSVNNEEGGYLACRHLLDLGHRQIGCISGPMGTQSSRQRLYGYIRALQEEGVRFQEALVVEGDFHIRSGQAVALQLLTKGVTAIFACNDLMAIGVYQAAAKLGLRVPEDFSVVGYDNLAISSILEVPLTTVGQPVDEMGTCAVRALMQCIEKKPDAQKSIMLTPSLIVRSSTRRVGE